jgi:FixJ family two-component response regulator
MLENDGPDCMQVLCRRSVMLPVILIDGGVTGHLRPLAQQRGVMQVLEKPLSDATPVDDIRGALSADA